MGGAASAGALSSVIALQPDEKIGHEQFSLQMGAAGGTLTRADSRNTCVVVGAQVTLPAEVRQLGSRRNLSITPSRAAADLGFGGERFYFILRHNCYRSGLLFFLFLP